MQTTVKKYRINSEDNFKNSTFESELNNFFSKGNDGFFEGKKGVSIYYNSFLQKNEAEENGAIVISSGRTEFALKYAEVIYDFFNNGYSVYIIDHRGQGFSDRIYKQDRELGYVDSFQFYVDDLKSFYDFKELQKNHKNLFLFGHSMGAAISTLYLEQFPKDFQAAVLTSPMFGFDFITCKAVKFLKYKFTEYARGKGNYNYSLEPFSVNTLTNSLVRYNKILELNEKFPKVKLGGPSYKWVAESCKAMRNIFKYSYKLSIPIKIFQAEKEKVVSLKAQEKFVTLLEKQGKVVELIKIPEAFHELLFEKDSIRKAVVIKTLDYLKNF